MFELELNAVKLPIPIISSGSACALRRSSLSLASSNPFVTKRTRRAQRGGSGERDDIDTHRNSQETPSEAAQLQHSLPTKAALAAVNHFSSQGSLGSLASPSLVGTVVVAVVVIIVVRFIIDLQQATVLL